MGKFDLLSRYMNLSHWSPVRNDREMRNCLSGMVLGLSQLPESAWEAVGRLLVSMGQNWARHVCGDSVLDSCKFRVSGRVPFQFIGPGSTVREHKEYYYFLEHLTEMSAIPLCTSLATWPRCDLQEDVSMQAVQPGGVPAVDQEQREQCQRVPPATFL